MTDVSCRVVLDSIEFMERKGFSVDLFLANLRAELGDGPETDRAFLTNRSNWISWRTFAAMNRQWDEMFVGSLGDEFVEGPLTEPYWYTAMIKPVLRVVSTPAQLYWLICKWAGPFNFPNLISSYKKQRDGRIFVSVRCRDEDEPAPFFFRTTVNMMIKIPRLIDYPDSMVEATVTDRSAEFNIVIAPSFSWTARIGRRIKAFLSAPMLLTELAQRDDQLRSSYLRLLQARGDLEAKVRDRTSELERANKELSTQIEALRRAERVAHIGSWEWDVKTRVLTWSDETYRIFDVPSDVVPVTSEMVLERTHPEDIAGLTLAYQRAEETDGFIVNEHRIIRPDGEIRHVMERGEVIFDDDGKPIRALGTVHDITLQKQYEATLIEAKNAADEANHAKTRFLANMSHEIRTPMSSILGFAELLGEVDAPLDRRQSYLEKILRNGRHLLALIDDALDLAKVEAGHLVIQSATCSPATELTQAIDLLRPQAEAKGLDLRVNLDANLPKTMTTDQVRLRQIMINVIGNAIKFTNKGKVQVTARRSEQMLEVTVEDTGGGVAPENQRLLFKPFSQLPGVARHSGSGLGLALARRLARALGGDVTLSASQIGVGSTFLVTVRLDLPNEQSAHTLMLDGGGTLTLGSEGRSGHLSGLKILVVEDTSDIQELLRRVLESVGAEVTVANDGIDCLDLVGKRSFDLVLLDMHMPRLDGFETIARLRQRGFKQPVIALTAYAMVDERKRSYEAGCDDFLAKPVETLTLLRTIVKWRNGRGEATS